MNYDHLNKISEYWKEKIFPYLSFNYNIGSFQEYIQEFCLLPSGKGMRDKNSIKMIRFPFVIDPYLFLKKYKNNCISFFSPMDVPKEGHNVFIHQISPVFHVESRLVLWVERERIQSYLMVWVWFIYNNDFERFYSEIEPMKRIGDTEKEKEFGFAAN